MAKVECAECGVLTTPDRADFAEGGGMIPDRWYCHTCQDIDSLSDDDEPTYDDPNQCPSCGDNLDMGDMCVHCDY